MATQKEVIDGASLETQLFLGRRLRKLRTEISGVLNINPFLMCAIKDFHQIKDQESLAQFMLIWHLGGGHATSLGKMIDERLLPNVFGTTRLDTTCRHQEPYNQPPFDDIDHVAHRQNGDYLLSLKASAWTIQYGQAMGLYRNFKELGDLGLQRKGIVVGVFYGHKGLLTDKYRIVKGENVRRQDTLSILPYVEVKAGAMFWSWLNDDQIETQEWLLEGILKGVEQFSSHNEDMAAIVGGAASQLIKELQVKYDLPSDGSINWSLLLHTINDDKGEEIGAEAIDAVDIVDEELHSSICQLTTIPLPSPD